VGCEDCTLRHLGFEPFLVRASKNSSLVLKTEDLHPFLAASRVKCDVNARPIHFYRERRAESKGIWRCQQRGKTNCKCRS
jgi:hypothetical protein